VCIDGFAFLCLPPSSKQLGDVQTFDTANGKMYLNQNSAIFTNSDMLLSYNFYKASLFRRNDDT